MKLVRTVALLVAHVASSTTRVHATRPDDWEQCADYPPNPTKDPIKITVTMDENGTADWATGNEAYWQTAKASIQELLQDATFNQVMGRVQELGLKNATDEIINVANDYGTDAQYGDEYQQIAQLLDVELFYVIVFNYFYEIAGQCTSFVVNGPDGTVMHGRNLDYTDLGGYTENTNTQVEFVNSAGETQYTCTTWAGYIGCLTGMRSGRFSVSLNQRYFNPGEGDIERRFIEFIQELQKHQFDKLAFGIYLRTQLFDDVDFESMVDDVAVNGNDGNFVNNAYITIGGVATDQGAVLRVPGVFRVKEQGEDTAVVRIGTSAFPCFADYCFQTNEDSMAMLNNEGPTELFRWNGGVENLQAAISDAAPLTPNLLFSRVLLVCPTYVTKDDFLTVYSVAMVPATGAYEGKTVITSGDESPSAQPLSSTSAPSAGPTTVGVTSDAPDFGHGRKCLLYVATILMLLAV